MAGQASWEAGWEEGGVGRAGGEAGKVEAFEWKRSRKGKGGGNSRRMQVRLDYRRHFLGAQR